MVELEAGTKGVAIWISPFVVTAMENSKSEIAACHRLLLTPSRHP